MSNPREKREPVQLMQEHAAETTQRLPIRVAPSTLTALGVFAFLAGIGLSIQVGKIRAHLENDPTARELPAEEIPKKPSKAELADVPTESEMQAGMAAYKADILSARAAQMEARVQQITGDNLGERTAAALWLREFSDGFDKLIEVLETGETLARREAANALSLSSNAPADKVGPALLRALQEDPDALTRAYAAEGVGRFRAEGGIEALTHAFDSDPDRNVRLGALLGLVWFDDLSTVPVFERALKESLDGDMRYIGSLAIARMGYSRRHEKQDEETCEAIRRLCVRMVQDANERVRANGARAAGYFRLVGMTGRLLGMLDPEVEVAWEPRCRAAEALGRIYERKAATRSPNLEHIVTTLVISEAYDEEAVVRWKCQEALARMAYNASDWGRLQILKTTPGEAVEGATAAEFYGGEEGDH